MVSHESSQNTEPEYNGNQVDTVAIFEILRHQDGGRLKSYHFQYCLTIVVKWSCMVSNESSQSTGQEYNTYHFGTLDQFEI